jgi:hypothetical protein
MFSESFDEHRRNGNEASAALALRLLKRDPGFGLSNGSVDSKCVREPRDIRPLTGENLSAAKTGAYREEDGRTYSLQ